MAKRKRTLKIPSDAYVRLIGQIEDAVVNAAASLEDEDDSIELHVGLLPNGDIESQMGDKGYRELRDSVVVAVQDITLEDEEDPSYAARQIADALLALL
jgi:hypothetical protein